MGIWNQCKSESLWFWKLRLYRKGFLWQFATVVCFVCVFVLFLYTSSEKKVCLVWTDADQCESNDWLQCWPGQLGTTQAVAGMAACLCSVYVYVCVCESMCVYGCVCVSVCVCMCVCVHVRACVCVWVFTCVHNVYVCLCVWVLTHLVAGRTAHNS